MRTDIAAGVLTLLQSGYFDLHPKLQIDNGDGTVVDVSSRIHSYRVPLPSPNTPLPGISVELLREATADPTLSLAPLVGASTLNRLDDGVTYSALLQAGRDVVFSLAVTAEGGARPADAGEFHEVWRGILDDWRTAELKWGGLITIDCVDPLDMLKVETERVYPAGTSIEDVAQAFLDDNGWASLVTLDFPASTGAVLSQDLRVRVQKRPRQVLWELAQSIGWVAWPRYSVAGVREFSFFEPDRDSATTQHTFPFVYQLSQAEIKGREIGNVGRLEYSDQNGERKTVGPQEDTDSISKYGGWRRSFWIVLPEDSPVRSEADATGMLAAALSDVAEPDVVVTGEFPALPFGEVSVDRYVIPENNQVFDSAQTLAPFANEIVHRAGQRPRSIISFRGRPSAGAKTWPRGGTVENPIWAFSLNDFREIGGAAEGYRRFGWNPGSKVAEVWYGYGIFQTPWTDDHWEQVAADVSPLPAGQNYVDVPEVSADNVGALQVEPRQSDGSIHAGDVVQRVELYPIPPRISGWVDARVESGAINVYAGAEPTFSALPITWEIRQGSQVGTVLASGTFTTIASAGTGVGPSTHAGLSGISLSMGRQPFWFLLIDAAGNVERVMDAVESVREGGLSAAEQFVASLSPILLVETLPAAGSRLGEKVFVFDSGDADYLGLFEWDGSTWNQIEPSVGDYSYLPVIHAGAVVTDHLAANAVTTEKLDAESVTAEKIAAGAITASSIEVSELSAISANLGSVSAGSIHGITGEFAGSVTIDTEGLGNSLSFEFDGAPVASFSTTEGAVALAAVSGEQIELGDQGVIIGSGVAVAINTTLGQLLLVGLPTSDPGVANQVWCDTANSRVLKLSAG